MQQSSKFPWKVPLDTASRCLTVTVCVCVCERERERNTETINTWGFFTSGIPRDSTTTKAVLFLRPIQRLYRRKAVTQWLQTAQSSHGGWGKCSFHGTHGQVRQSQCGAEWQLQGTQAIEFFHSMDSFSLQVNWQKKTNWKTIALHICPSNHCQRVASALKTMEWRHMHLP